MHSFPEVWIIVERGKNCEFGEERERERESLLALQRYVSTYKALRENRALGGYSRERGGELAIND